MNKLCRRFTSIIFRFRAPIGIFTLSAASRSRSSPKRDEIKDYGRNMRFQVSHKITGNDKILKHGPTIETRMQQRKEDILLPFLS